MSSPQAGCISVDGRLFEPPEATVSALDSGFLLGDGLFESLRATNGGTYLLDRHLARLQAATTELGYTGVPSPARISEEVDRVLDRAALDDAYVRITVTRGRGAAALASPSGPATVVIAALPAPARPPGKGIGATLIGPPLEQGPVGKSTSRQYAVRARQRIEGIGAEEGIYVSGDDYVLEGVSSNVFIVLGVVLLTPRVDECLPGITRGRVLELAAEAGIEFLESPIEREYFQQAKEVFVTNAVQGPRAVRSIDGRQIEDWRPETGGDVFAKLLGLYEADRRKQLG